MEFRFLQHTGRCRSCNATVERNKEKVIFIKATWDNANKKDIIICKKCVRAMNTYMNNDEAYSGSKFRVEIDMTGRRCSKCGAGTYQEMSMWDEEDGVLHCNNCNHETERYRPQVERV